MKEINTYMRIRDLCKETGMSIRKLERELGLGNSAVSKWVKSIPSSKNLKQVADYFNVTQDYLLGTSEEKFTYPYNLVAESHTAYNIDRERDLPKGYRVIDACDVINYMIDGIDSPEKTIVFDREIYNSDEELEAKIVLLQAIRDLKKIRK